MIAFFLRNTLLYSNAEVKVVKGLLRGMSNGEIKDELFVAVKTIKYHLTSCREKLNHYLKKRKRRPILFKRRNFTINLFYALPLEELIEGYVKAEDRRERNKPDYVASLPVGLVRSMPGVHR